MVVHPRRDSTVLPSSGVIAALDCPHRKGNAAASGVGARAHPGALLRANAALGPAGVGGGRAAPCRNTKGPLQKYRAPFARVQALPLLSVAPGPAPMLWSCHARSCQGTVRAQSRART